MADESSVAFIERPKRGRPRSAEPGSSLSVWVPVSHHDQLITMAKKHRTSVSRLVRTLLVLQLRREPFSY